MHGVQEQRVKKKNKKKKKGEKKEKKMSFGNLEWGAVLVQGAVKAGQLLHGHVAEEGLSALLLRLLDPRLEK